MQVDMNRSIIWEGTARLRRYDFIADLHLLAQTLNSSSTRGGKASPSQRFVNLAAVLTRGYPAPATVQPP